MKQFRIALSIILVLAVINVAPALAGQDQNDHAMHPQTGMSGKMSHDAHKMQNYREVTVDGYQLTYHLMDIREKMKSMQGMKGMEKMKDITHHLMVYIKSPNGHKVTDAKVGYFIVDKNGKTQKQMAMGMGAGYGADVSFSQDGAYDVKVKVMTQDKKLMDTFTHHAH